MSSIDIPILSFFVFVFFVFFRFANPRLLNFHRRKKEAKTGKTKTNKTKQKQNKTDRTLLWRSKRHTCLRKAAQLKRPSPTDSRLKKCTTFRHLACTRVIKLASFFFVRGEVGFRLFFFFSIWHIVLLCFDTYKGFFCGKKKLIKKVALFRQIFRFKFFLKNNKHLQLFTTGSNR
jgi:hypothetical protein